MTKTINMEFRITFTFLMVKIKVWALFLPK